MGPAPVPLDQYNRIVQSQRRRTGWLTPKMLAEACAGMVITPETLAQAGPAVSAGKSLLIHGLPGNGKTHLAEALAELDPSPIFLPYAIECQGIIIQVFDPKYHQVTEPASFGEGDVVIATLRDAAIDPAWQLRTARAYGARVIELDSGHSPFLTQPDELADVLDALA